MLNEHPNRPDGANCHGVRTTIALRTLLPHYVTLGRGYRRSVSQCLLVLNLRLEWPGMPNLTSTSLGLASSGITPCVDRSNFGKLKPTCIDRSRSWKGNGGVSVFEMLSADGEYVLKAVVVGRWPKKCRGEVVFEHHFVIGPAQFAISSVGASQFHACAMFSAQSRFGVNCELVFTDGSNIPIWCHHISMPYFTSMLLQLSCRCSDASAYFDCTPRQLPGASGWRSWLGGGHAFGLFDGGKQQCSGLKHSRQRRR